MKIWFLLKAETQIKLAKYFEKLAGYPFKPPIDDSEFEKPEEIKRLMRQTRRYFK